MKTILVDAGPLVALLDADDRHHRACALALEEIRAPLATVWPAVAEAAYLLGSVSSAAQDDLLGMLEGEGIGLLSLGPGDIPRIRELMAKYADLPMDLADACLVRVAERERLDTVLTIDRRDFRVYRPSHVRTFRILPR